MFTNTIAFSTNPQTNKYLAPELKPIDDAMRKPFDTMESIESMINTGDNIDSKLFPFAQNEVLPALMTKGIMDAMIPSFKMPPAVSVPPGALGPGHFTMEDGQGVVGIPNSEKNHISSERLTTINMKGTSHDTICFFLLLLFLFV
jgi:hypothetical protein